MPPLVDLMELIGRSVRPRIVRIPLIDDASLRGLTMPLLAIVGGKDVLLDSEGARRRLADTSPQAEMHFLSAAHHLILGQGQNPRFSESRQGELTLCAA